MVVVGSEDCSGQAQSLVTGRTKRYTEETQGPASLR